LKAIFAVILGLISILTGANAFAWCHHLGGGDSSESGCTCNDDTPAKQIEYRPSDPDADVKIISQKKDAKGVVTQVAVRENFTLMGAHSLTTYYYRNESDCTSAFKKARLQAQKRDKMEQEAHKKALAPYE
jgi:ABC-type sugar transport system ATPase subunit